eukprot:m.76733 g.76733  ORF g.76733 m.76733 type:complete len:211 (+) comp10553_c0_seq1:8855-9487(+)
MAQPGEATTEESLKREPCPWRILDDAGGAFAMGAIGGGLISAFKGWNTTPRGYQFQGMVRAVRMRGPLWGGQFAIWGAMFSTFDCSLMAIRDKDDPWNSIASGALTGGTLAIRQGPAAATMGAVFGGFILAMIEGVQIAMMRANHEAAPPVQAQLPGTPLDASLPPPPPPPPSMSPNPPSSGGYDGGSDSFSSGSFESSPAAPPEQKQWI